MTNKKITKKDRYTEMTAIFEGMGRTDLADFCSHEIELLAKKNAGKSKVTKAEQEKRDALTECVLAILTKSDKPMQNKDICKAMPTEMGVVTTQRLTHILSAMVDNGALAVVTEKGAKLYSVV